MSAPYVEHGLLTKAIRWVRTRANEPRASAKYSDTRVLELLSEELASVTEDAYAMAVHPPYAEFTLVPVSGQQRYMLPPNVKEVHRIGVKDTTTGLWQWEVKPLSRNYPLGPQVVFEGGNIIRFLPTPSGNTALVGETITVEYIPGGVMPMHQSVLAVYSADNDTGTQLLTTTGGRLIATSTSWFMGEFDRRPNAFLGQVLRLLATPTDKSPTGYNFFPVQERPLTSYAVATGAVAWSPPLDFDPSTVSDKAILIPAIDIASGRTYFIGEVVPNVDSALFGLAAIQAAQVIATAENRSDVVGRLATIEQRAKRAALLRWSNYEQRIGHHFDSTEEIFWDDGMS